LPKAGDLVEEKKDHEEHGNRRTSRGHDGGGGPGGVRRERYCARKITRQQRERCERFRSRSRSGRYLSFFGSGSEVTAAARR
jgi:hypothetical protein